MDLVAHLERVLRQYQTNPPAEELRLTGWRFSLNDLTNVKVGIRDNKLAEVYAAPTVNANYTGDLLLVWAGDRCSHAVLNAAIITALEDNLPEWERAAFHDTAGSVILSPQPMPLVAVEHHAAREIVKNSARPLFELLAQYQREMPHWGVSSLQAGAQASWGLRHIRTSQGLAVTYGQTTFSTYVAADGLFSKSFVKRRPPTVAEIAELIETTGKMTQLLKNQAELRPGQLPIIFAPSVVEELISKYLVGNLSGNNVVNNLSAYDLADFRQCKQVFAPTIAVVINPLDSYELSSYLCTREGVPARAQYLVEAGKLLTPYLTVKDSIKAEMRPTPLPQGSGMRLETGTAANLADLISDMDEGILVTSVLGLHTQDSSSGNYSLAAPQSLKIENGKLKGRVKAVIGGNFLQHLADPCTRYAGSKGENAPAMQVAAHVVKG